MTDLVAGGCHCGAVRFEAVLKGGVATVRRCTCSLCRMRGAVTVTAAVGDLQLVRGADRLTSYRFNTGVAEHFFCATCGIYTHHQRRSDPDEYGVNFACLDGRSPFDIPAMPVMDGERHSSDTGIVRQVGTLRFEPASDR